jgi:hypothetical protein
LETALVAVVFVADRALRLSVVWLVVLTEMVLMVVVSDAGQVEPVSAVILAAPAEVGRVGMVASADPGLLLLVLMVLLVTEKVLEVWVSSADRVLVPFVLGLVGEA